MTSSIPRLGQVMRTKDVRGWRRQSNDPNPSLSSLAPILNVPCCDSGDAMYSFSSSFPRLMQANPTTICTGRDTQDMPRDIPLVFIHHPIKLLHQSGHHIACLCQCELLA